MKLVCIFEHSKSNAVNRRVAPSLIKEASSTIEMVEIVLVRLASPKFHIGNLKVAPKVACRVSLSLAVVVRTVDIIGKPLHSTVLVEVVRMLCQEFDCFWPQGWKSLGVVVQVDSESVGFIIVVHVTEDIILNVAKEVHLGFNTPVVARVL